MAESTSQPDRAPEEALRGKAISGAKWGALASLSAFLFSFGQNIALGRLLAPSDFGLAGMIWAVLGLAQLLSDAGMSGVILYRQGADKREVSSVFWVNVLVAAFLSALLIAAAPLLVWFNREPALAELVPWAVAGFFLSCVAAPLRTLAQRDLMFTGLAMGEIAGGAAALAAALGVALAGHGVYALLMAGIAGAAVKMISTVYILRRDFPVTFSLRWADVRGLASFGLYQLGDRMANYLWSNLDYLLVGRMLGAGALGFYRMAYETAIRPLSVVNPIMNSVAYPLFAKKQNDLEAMRRGYLDMVELLAALVMPLLGGLAVTAELVLEAVFGPKWLPAAPALRILCLLGVLRCLQNPIGALVIGRGMPRVGFLYNGGLLILNALVFPVAISYGIEALCWAAVFTMAFSMAALWKPVYRRMIDLPAADWLRRLRTAACMSGIMMLAVQAVLAMAPAGWPPAAKLAAAVTVGGAVYLGAYWFWDRKFVAGFAEMLLKRGEKTP